MHYLGNFLGSTLKIQASMQVDCTQCTRVFKTVEAMKQHRNAVHRAKHDCAECNRSFKTLHALSQHDMAVHEFSDTESDTFVEYGPPFPDAVGEWVEPEQCTQLKSFGWFECVLCDKEWMSAHAQAGYAQGCKTCNNEDLPVCMWQNEFGVGDKREGAATTKPHDRGRCEACRAGSCLNYLTK